MRSVGGVWWRHLPHGGGPLRHAEPAADGRWQRGGTVAALCLADEEETARAEWYRSLAERGLPPEMGLPRDLWSYAVELTEVADLTTDAALADHGLEAPRPTRRQWPSFQRLGEALFGEGARGILYRSAARPEAQALCVFAAERGFPALTPVPPPRTFTRPPPRPGREA
jgi:RES domain-containing protein